MALSPLPSVFPTWANGLAACARAVNRLINGEMNVTGTVTLTASAATTTVTDRRCGLNSRVSLDQATTANAAGAIATTYIDPAEYGVGSFKIRHANNAQTDRTFRYTILG